MTFNKKLKGFTLVEMLIVIVIIGVLAAAIIPRLTSVRDRANDVARRADLNQLTTAIIAYQMDKNGLLPGTGVDSQDAGSLAEELKNSGLSSIPTDPVKSFQVDGLGDYTTTAGEYSFMHIERNGQPSSSFVLMAKTETPGASNWVYDSTSGTGFITTGSTLTDLTPCVVTMDESATGVVLIPGGDCIASDYSQLRYIIAR